MRAVEEVGVRLIAGVAKLLQGLVGLGLLGGRGQQTLRLQARASVGDLRGRQQVHVGVRGVDCGPGGAALVERGKGHVVVERLRLGRDRASAALDGGGRCDLDLGLADDDAADPVLPVLLGRRQRRAAAVRDARSDREDLTGMVLAGDGSAAGVAAARAKLLVQHVVRELDGVQRVEAPVLFRVELRVRMLDGEPVRARRVERSPLGVGQRGGEVGSGAGVGGGVTDAVDLIDGVVPQVMDAHPAALVGVGDGAAVLEAPVSRCGDAAVYPARSRRRAGHDARFVLIEARGHLHHHGDVDATGAVVVVGKPFFTGDPARVERGIPVHVDVRAVQGGVAAVEDGIHERAVVHVDRSSPQLRCRGIRRIDESRRRRSGRADRRRLPQARHAQAAGQQIVAAAVVRRGDDRPRDHKGRQRILVGAGSARRHGQEQQEGALRQEKPPLSDSQSP